MDDGKGEILTPKEIRESDLEMGEAPDPADEEISTSTAAPPGDAPLLRRNAKVFGGKLPDFSLGQHTMNVATGLRREKELRDQEKLEESRRKAE